MKKETLKTRPEKNDPFHKKCRSLAPEAGSEETSSSFLASQEKKGNKKNPKVRPAPSAEPKKGQEVEMH